ncbi:MAG: site-specific integrase [Prevotellaceae bacterium]|nr:site-specific integrase [Prevotellaceae bacterium]
MTSVRLKFNGAAESNKGGRLYFQVIHDRVVRQLGTGYNIYEEEWDEWEGEIIVPPGISDKRRKELDHIREEIRWQNKRLDGIICTLSNREEEYTANDIVSLFQTENNAQQPTVFSFFRNQITQLRQIGKVGTAATYQQTLNSIMRFLQNRELSFDDITSEFMLAYEAWLHSSHLCRNTTSFYMRILRTVYNKAIEQQLTVDQQPFKHVYTGIDKTAKRAVFLADIRRIKNANLSYSPTLEFARDIFLLSFYLRGIAPIDLAFLRKSDLSNGHLTYCRRKTGQQINIQWEKHMQQIIDKYPNTGTQYMLPFIQHEDCTEMQQYRVMARKINRKLKKLSSLLRISTPLTLYVARHSWASIAYAENVPVSVISGAIGHDSEATTQIYLASIQISRIDQANHNILSKL